MADPLMYCMLTDCMQSCMHLCLLFLRLRLSRPCQLGRKKKKKNAKAQIQEAALAVTVTLSLHLELTAAFIHSAVNSLHILSPLALHYS